MKVLRHRRDFRLIHSGSMNACVCVYTRACVCAYVRACARVLSFKARYNEHHIIMQSVLPTEVLCQHGVNYLVQTS